MNNSMEYNGFRANVEYVDEDGCFVGHIAGITDIIGSHGESVSQLRTAFHEAVEDYIEICAKTGKKPQKSASGKMLLRISPELHARAAQAAEAAGTSINKWVSNTIAKHV